MHALPEFLYLQIRQSIRMHFLPTSSHEKEIPLNSIMIYGKMQDAPDEFLLSSQCRLLHPGPGILRSGRPAKEVRGPGGTYCIRHLFSVKYLFIFLLDVS